MAVKYLEWLADQETENKLYLRWAIAGQYSMSFEDFKGGLKPVKQKSDDEILSNVYDIIGRFNGGN